MAFGTLATKYLRPHPLGTADYCMWAFCFAMGLFYFWVAYAVFMRRRYIYNIALACAGIWILGIPSGTILSILLITNLVSARYSFTK